MIEKRSPAKLGEVDPDEREETWRESARRHAAELREAARAEWTLYHEHMSELHQRLAAEHREKAQKLLEESDARKEVA
jgi:hypothetical protein